MQEPSQIVGELGYAASIAVKPADWPTLSPKALSAMAPAAFAYLPGDAVPALTPAILGGLSAAQAAQLTTSTIAAMGQAQLDTLLSTHGGVLEPELRELASHLLTFHRACHLEEGTIHGATMAELPLRFRGFIAPALRVQDVPRLTGNTISWLPQWLVASLSEQQLMSFTKPQVQVRPELLYGDVHAEADGLVELGRLM